MRILLLAAASVALTADARAQTSVLIEPIVVACVDVLAVADRNGDGWITRQEAEAAIVAHFALLDGNADGGVTLDEFTACRAGAGLRTTTTRTAVLRADHPLFAADLDGDRALDEMEWSMTAERLYNATPKDAQGRVVAATFDTAMQGFAMSAAEADTDGDGMIGTLEAVAAIRNAFLVADANGDGIVTFAEFATRVSTPTVSQTERDEEAIRAQLATVWRGMDTNGDGIVSLKELRATVERRFVAAANVAASDPDVAVPVSALAQVPLF